MYFKGFRTFLIHLTFNYFHSKLITYSNFLLLILHFKQRAPKYLCPIHGSHILYDIKSIGKIKYEISAFYKAQLLNLSKKSNSVKPAAVTH